VPATGKHLPFSPATREQGKREHTRVTYRDSHEAAEREREYSLYTEQSMREGGSDTLIHTHRDDYLKKGEKKHEIIFFSVRKKERASVQVKDGKYAKERKKRGIKRKMKCTSQIGQICKRTAKKKARKK